MEISHLIYAHFIWGMQVGHNTRPGHANMQHWRMTCDWCLVVFLAESFLQQFISEWVTATIFRPWTPFMQVRGVPKSLPRGLGNVGHLHEWRTISEDGAAICHVKCITLGFMYFSRLDRTLSESWTTLHWWRMCVRCVDVDIVWPLVTWKMEALSSPKHRPTAWFCSPKDGNLHSYPCYFLL
jgi:hypothetical protein